MSSNQVLTASVRHDWGSLAETAMLEPLTEREYGQNTALSGRSLGFLTPHRHLYTMGQTKVTSPVTVCLLSVSKDTVFNIFTVLISLLQGQSTSLLQYRGDLETNAI